MSFTFNKTSDLTTQNERIADTPDLELKFAMSIKRESCSMESGCLLYCFSDILSCSFSSQCSIFCSFFFIVKHKEWPISPTVLYLMWLWQTFFYFKFRRYIVCASQLNDNIVDGKVIFNMRKEGRKSLGIMALRSMNSSCRSQLLNSLTLLLPAIKFCFQNLIQILKEVTFCYIRFI